MTLNLSDCLDAAIAAARAAATELESWRSRFTIWEKGRADLVTEADLAAQLAARTLLSERFPEHRFLGEEDGVAPPRPVDDAPPTWIVDPLDGTTNYVHDVPAYCVSIGLYVNGDVPVGVVFDPRQDELFVGVAGRGATLNGRPIRTSSVASLDQALLATGFPPNLVGEERQLDWWRYFALRSQAVRRTGSTALNLVYVAAGRFDGYWGFDNKPWDVAGSIPIIREAGGQITAIDGGPYNCFVRPLVATNGPLHPVMLAALRDGP